MPSTEKIRVIIVDDIADARENIKRMLQFDTNIDVAGAARTGREAIELSQQIKPDVLIMDINMPDMDGITATDAIRKKLPYAQVIILSVQNDPSYMRRAMLAGARDFLTKPPNIDELTGAVRRAGAMAQEERAKLVQSAAATAAAAAKTAASTEELGKVITIYSPKGGTGRTTLLTNLAMVLHSDDKKTVIVDGNLQFGDVAVFINEQGKNSILDLAPRVDELDPEIVSGVMITHRGSGVHLLAPPPRPELADDVTGEQFAKLLNYLRTLYAYVLVDTTSQLTDIVQSALEVSQVIILVTTQDIPAIKSTSQFLAIADQAGMRERLLFIFNRFDKRIGISPERVGESLKQPIVLAIPDDRLIANAVNKGIPFVLENKTNPLSKYFVTLADLIKEKINQQTEKAAAK